MTSPYLALESASFILPDGRTLLSGLTENFDTRHTGLVGRNGVGKSVLARLLAGQLAPASGRCIRSGQVCYLSQQAGQAVTGTVASLAGVQAVFDALARIDAGSIAASDFECVGERWDLPARFAHVLEQAGLGHLDAATPAARLSGGEAMRVALLGALLSEADFLILDEPTNGLDVMTTRALRGFLRELRDEGRCVIFSSHIMQEVAALCDTIVIIAKGTVMAAGTADELRALTGEANLEDAFVKAIGNEEGLHA